MTKFMKLFLSFAVVSCHCGLAQEFQVSYTTELQSDFKQGSNWVNLLRLDFTHSLGKHTTLQAATISTARTRTESLADDFRPFPTLKKKTIRLPSLHWASSNSSVIPRFFSASGT